MGHSGTVDINFPELDSDSPFGQGVTTYTLIASLETILPAQLYTDDEFWMIWDNSPLHTSREMAS
jgi:hypothetical protein